MRLKILIGSVLFLALGESFVKAQFTFMEEPYQTLQVSFLKEKEEVTPEKSFFNALQVSNPSNRRLRFEVNFGVPAGWIFMGQQSQVIVIDPGEKKLIPIRISANKNTLGDIGYSIVASLKDNTGKTFKNAYFYVNVPRLSNIHIRTLERQIYFDPQLKSSQIGIGLNNSGNVDELFNIQFFLPQTVIIDGSVDNFFKSDILLAPGRDTVVYFTVKLNNTPEASEIKDHRILLDAGNKDTTFRYTIWAKRLESRHELEIPMSDRVLVIELAMLNLFSQHEPIYEGAFWGNIYGKEDFSLEYFFRSVGANFYKDDPIKYSRAHLKTQYKNYHLNIGDVSQSVFTSSYGKGVQFIYTNPKLFIDASASQNLLSNSNNAGIIFRSNLIDRTSIKLSYSEQWQKNSFREAMPSVGISFPLFKHHQISTDLGYAMNEYITPDNVYKNNGIGGLAIFTVNYPKLKWNTKSNFGDKNFVGFAKGKIDIFSDFTYYLDNNQNFYTGNYSGFMQKMFQSAYTYMEEDNNLEMHTHTLHLKYNYQIDPQFTLNIGPWIDYRGGNSFYRFNPDDWFAAQTTMAYTSLRYRSKSAPLNLFFEMRGGVSYITDYSSMFNGVEIPGIDNHKRLYANFFASSSLLARRMNLNLAYYHGPYTINQFYNLFYASQQSRSVRVIGSFNQFFLKKILEYSFRGSYTYEISTQANRVGLNNEITGKFGQGWTASFGNTIGIQSTFDKINEAKYRYQNMYFEFRITKEFGFGQPSFKYHRLNLRFYKDLNGNGRFDAGEPGVENVMVSIDKDYLLSDSIMGNRRQGDFYAMEFLSDLNGQVVYRNIPTGYYTIKFLPVGKSIDKFVTESSSLQIYLNKDQNIDIPFVEKNKIFGQIILNRSKLSNLGHIDVSNIKVTATDSRGRMFSTLTDKYGKFVIYVPNIEKYIVSINNIFREHFELEQNAFEVQLNGYKQFELTFIFTEKQRRINFNQQISPDASSQQVQTVRRTNLSGSVKDVNTSAPVKATIRIIEETNGNIVAETQSESRTGNFFVSFIAGNNYRLDISADDYWFYSEKLVIDQLSTFMNLNRDVSLSPIAIGAKIPLPNLIFERNSAELSEEAKIELSRFVQILKQNPTIQIEIVGHADDVEALGNVDIGMERTKTVARYLTENNYTAFTTRSAGSTEPAINEASEQARKVNRRAEMIVTSK